jgi:hypothetical protein
MAFCAEISPDILGVSTFLDYPRLDKFVAFHIALVYTLP